MARQVDVDVTTLRRWVNGATRPKPGRFRTPRRALFLPEHDEPRPYLLLDGPLTHAAQVAGLH